MAFFTAPEERAVAFFISPEGQAAARDLQLVASHGVHKYPTLVLLYEGQAYPLPGVGDAPEVVTQHLDRVLNVPARS